MELYATLPPGLEDVAAKEIKTLGGKITEIRYGKGRIFARRKISEKLHSRAIINTKIVFFIFIKIKYKIIDNGLISIDAGKKFSTFRNR
jgi:23S rRNA G2445 N2-methylase RlmL